SVRSRSKGRGDSDARTMAAKNRAMSGEARHARKVTRLRRAVERAGEQVADFDLRKERGRTLFIDYQPAPKPYLMAVDRERLEVAGQTLLRDVRAVVARDSRIHLAGHNGAGKTTLLRALLDSATTARARILHMPQTLDEAAGRAALDRLRALDRSSRGRLLQLAAALGLDPERLHSGAAAGDYRPSPGEVRKLILAEGLAAGAWAVVLDEPTNHLDLPSIERLEDALRCYPGALVLVSHDARLAGALTSEVWTLADNRLTVSAAEPLSDRSAR
ncbi:MAG: ATP-binding cassette domain-containing protein, partial [Myxococcota bacterium]